MCSFPQAGPARVFYFHPFGRETGNKGKRSGVTRSFSVSSLPRQIPAQHQEAVLLVDWGVVRHIKAKPVPFPLTPSAGPGDRPSPADRHTLRLQPLGGCGTGSSPLFGRRPPTPQIFPVRCAGSGELQSRRRQHRTAEMANKACTHHRPAPSPSAKEPGAGALGSFGRCYSVLGRGRALMLWRLTPRVDRLWSMAEVAGGSSPRTPRAMRHPLKPRTNR